MDPFYGKLFRESVAAGATVQGALQDIEEAGYFEESFPSPVDPEAACRWWPLQRDPQRLRQIQCFSLWSPIQPLQQQPQLHRHTGGQLPRYPVEMPLDKGYGHHQLDRDDRHHKDQQCPAIQATRHQRLEFREQWGENRGRHTPP